MGDRTNSCRLLCPSFGPALTCINLSVPGPANAKFRFLNEAQEIFPAHRSNRAASEAFSTPSATSFGIHHPSAAANSPEKLNYTASTIPTWGEPCFLKKQQNKTRKKKFLTKLTVHLLPKQWNISVLSILTCQTTQKQQIKSSECKKSVLFYSQELGDFFFFYSPTEQQFPLDFGWLNLSTLIM